MLFAIIVFLFIVLTYNLAAFIPGVLGAITVYILSRKKFFQYIYLKKMKPSTTAILFIVFFLLVLSVPMYLTGTLISPKIGDLIANKDKILGSITTLSDKIAEATNIRLISPQTIEKLTSKASEKLPNLLNSTLSIFMNVFTMFFLLYFMLVNGSAMERALNKLIPLQKDSVNALAKETRSMIRANAIGIPVISIIQGLVAGIGYWIFGVKEPVLWGFLTGIFAFFPIVGTMIIWVPLVGLMVSQGESVMAIGLALYSLLITGNVDYVARMSLMKKMGDVHPLVTVFGVIIGLKIFGFLGLVFGPLLISYFMILVKIYVNEFSASAQDKAELQNNAAENGGAAEKDAENKAENRKNSPNYSLLSSFFGIFSRNK